MAEYKSPTTLNYSGISTADANDYRTRLSNLLSSAPAKTATQTSTVPVINSQIKTPTIVAPVKPVETSPVQQTTKSYTVVGGDSLSKIAQANGMSLQQLLELNPNYKANPNLVKVGATLNLGGTSVPIVDTTTKPVVEKPVVATAITPEQKAINDQQTLAQNAGSAGLSVEEYTKLYGANNNVSKVESDAIAKELGITDLEGKVFAKPSKSSQDIFDQAYASTGLADVKAKIDALNAEIATDRSNLSDAVGAIDENPFLTETSRVGRGKRVLDQAEQKINNKLSQIDAYQKLYDSGITEINNSILRTQNDFNTNQAIDTAQLNYLQTKAEKEATQLQNTKNIVPNTVMSAYLKAKAEGKAPTMIGSSDTGYYKYDETTGKFIQAVKPTTSTNNEYALAQKFVTDNPNATPEEIEQGIRANTKGLSESDIKSLLPSTLNRANIAKLYGITDDDTKTAWFGLGKTNKEKIDEVMDSIAQYKAVGTSDADIIKLIKGE